MLPGNPEDSISMRAGVLIGQISVGVVQSSSVVPFLAYSINNIQKVFESSVMFEKIGNHHNSVVCCIAQYHSDLRSQLSYLDLLNS